MKSLVQYIRESYRKASKYVDEISDLENYIRSIDPAVLKTWPKVLNESSREMWMHESLEFIKDWKLLDDSFMKRDPAERLQNALYDKFSLKEGQVLIRRNHAKKFGDCIIFVGVDTGKNCELVSKLALYYGFFEAMNRMAITDPNTGLHYVQMVFEPFEEKDCTSEIKKHTDVLYHFAPEKYESAIDSDGLVPKSENRLDRYPPRTFFVLGNTPDNVVMYLLNKLKTKNNKGSDVYIKYAVKIDDIKQGIFFDPDSIYAVYIEKAVKADVIKKIKKISLDI